MHRSAAQLPHCDLFRPNPPLDNPAPDNPASDLVIWGITRQGRRFRPSDWGERLAGLTAAYNLSDRLRYSSLVLPARIGSARAVIVSGKLAAAEPRLHRFLLGFARDNDLVTQELPEPMTSPLSLEPPEPPSHPEPHEPV